MKTTKEGGLKYNYKEKYSLLRAPEAKENARLKESGSVEGITAGVSSTALPEEDYNVRQLRASDRGSLFPLLFPPCSFPLRLAGCIDASC